MPTRRTIDAAVSAVLASTREAVRGKAAAVAERAVGEETFAELVVDQLLKLTGDSLRVRSAWRGYQGAAVARQLLDSFDLNYNRWPPEWQLAVADAALLIARASDRTSPTLLFRAWKERANALRVLNQFSEAFASLDEAEEFATDTHCARLHYAILANSRAAVYCEMGRGADALPPIAEAREKFLACGLATRAGHTRAVEAGARWSMHEYEKVLRLCHSLLQQAIASGDDEMAAFQLGNIGAAYVLLGELDAARRYLQRARDIYLAFRWIVCSAKIQVSLGRLAVREHGLDAVAQFEVACAELDRLGMYGEAATSRLKLASELLAADPSADVSGLCRQAHDRALSLGMVNVAEDALRLLGNCANRDLDAQQPM